MRQTIIICALAMLAGCAGNEPYSASWSAYCDRYGVDKDNPTTEQYNTWLDAYVGSTEEEADMDGK